MPPRRIYPGRPCRVCGRFVYLNRRGEYRRALGCLREIEQRYRGREERVQAPGGSGKYN